MHRYKAYFTLLLRAALPAVIICLLPAVAFAAEVDCLKCHEKLVKNKAVVHAAVQMGCPTCHSGIDDALKTPHKKTTAYAKGLSADQPDICYGCHDKEKFTKTVVHSALQMGCTACHDPHGSNKPKLLSSDVPELCFSCHDKADFSRKNVHSPVAGGMCLACHDPHSSVKAALVAKPLSDLCADCHDRIINKPHAIGGSGHPTGQPKKDRSGKELPLPADPKRPGKPFSCASCHHPHSSDSRRLFRYPARSAMELCMNCHQY